LVILTIDTNGMKVCSVNVVVGVFGERKGTACEERDLEKKKYKKTRWK